MSKKSANNRSDTLNLYRLRIVIANYGGVSHRAYYFSDPRDLKKKLFNFRRRLGNSLLSHYIEKIRLEGEISARNRYFHELFDWEVDELIEDMQTKEYSKRSKES